MSKMYAVRFDNKVFEKGEELLPSHVWDDGTRTEEVLNGTSCIFLEIEEDDIDTEYARETINGVVEKYKNYYCLEHAYVVFADSQWNCFVYEWGQDEDEIVINRPEVLEILY